MKNILIIGGTSGLGLELATILLDKYNVFVTGRHKPQNDKLQFIQLDIGSDNDSNVKNLDRLIKAIPNIEMLIYAAGYYHVGEIDKLSDDEISQMVNVGLVIPIFLIQRILKRQNSLPCFVAVTSTSQWKPRLLEPVYASVKAGLGMLANSLALDPRIKKTLVAGPAGMKTNFWKNVEKNTCEYLEPKWVAEQIVNELKETYKYKFIKILRCPQRVEVVEKRM